MNFQERQQLADQLGQVTALRDALKAFRLIDISLQITIGSNWLEEAHMCDVVADINGVLAGFLVPDDTGRLRRREVQNGLHV